jgi:peptidoglycan/LPS O-acetylase OafA/YrhL
MMAGCAAAGWFILAPADYARLGMTVLSAALSLSNVQFWRDAGYFDTPASEKPLLHTWSLGVEEQFYLVFPLYMILVARHLARWRLPLTAALCAASFAIGAVGAFHDPVAAFYLPHARLWELLIGGLLAMNLLPAPARLLGRSAAMLLGLGLIAFAVLGYSGATIFPGLAALPPALGAALVIWAGTGSAGGSAMATRALAARPLVFLGKISYSLYLWHFPLLAFGLYLGLGALGPAQAAGLVALAFALSLLSWRFVEQPARRAGVRLPWRRVAALAGSSALTLAVLGVAVQLLGGVPARMSDDAAGLIAGGPLRNPDRQSCFVSARGTIDLAAQCALGDAAATPTFVLWGDSHAEAMRGALDAAAAARGRAGLFAGESACPPLIGATRPQKPACTPINEGFLRALTDSRSIETVILSARWGWWAESVPYKSEGGTPVTLAFDAQPAGGAGNHAALAAGLEATVSALLDAGKRVWLVGPVPEVGYNVPRYFYLRSLGFAEGLDIAPTLAEFDRRQAFVLATLNDLARRYPVGTIWPHELLCNDTGCAIARDGKLLYSDDDHLSVFGARSIAGLFTPVFE